MMMPRKLAVIVVLAVALTLPFLAKALGNPALVTLATRVIIYAIAAASLNLIIGYGGMVSFGHAAYFGLGGYVIGILYAHAVSREPLLGFIPGTDLFFLTIPAAMLISGLAAAALGALSLRTSGVQFIMITLAFSQMVFFLFLSLKAYGGDDGLIVRRRNLIPGLDMRDDSTVYYVCLTMLALFLWAMSRVARSPFGFLLQGIRQNERRIAAIGVPAYRYKLAAFVIAAMGAGLAGALMANFARFVSPDMLHWTKSGELMIMVVLGGMGTLFGPVAGAAALIGLETVLTAWTEHWQLILGPLLVLIVLFSRGGLAGLAGKLLPALASDQPAGSRRAVSAEQAPSSKPAAALVLAEASSVPVLETRGLVKTFGGLVATDNLAFNVLPGELHAVIGPNGAGKTTFISQICGELQPDSGAILINGSPVNTLAAASRAKLGVARTFQITQLLPDYSALENVMLALQARRGHSFRFFGEARSDEGLQKEAREHLAYVGLSAGDAPVAVLSHGERKLVELAIALAMRPRLLLLDEPLAGLGASESLAAVEIIRSLKGRIAVVLVEHDMAAVFDLADRISVLVNGRCIVSGTPESVRGNPEVRTAYLGEGDA